MVDVTAWISRLMLDNIGEGNYTSQRTRYFVTGSLFIFLKLHSNTSLTPWKPAASGNYPRRSPTSCRHDYMLASLLSLLFLAPTVSCSPTKLHYSLPPCGGSSRLTFFATSNICQRVKSDASAGFSQSLNRRRAASSRSVQTE